MGLEMKDSSNIVNAYSDWEKNTYAPAIKKFPEREDKFTTNSFAAVTALYTTSDRMSTANGSVSPGSTPSRAAFNPLCTVENFGQCASTRVSAPQKNRMHATGICSRRYRPDYLLLSICRRRLDMTAIRLLRRVKLAGLVLR